MRPYPREYLWFVERVLREYPYDLAELRELEKTIVARCWPNALGSEVDSGDPASVPERIVEAKESHEHYQWLLWRVEQVQNSLCALTDKQREFVRLTFYDGLRLSELAEELNIDPRNVRRLKVRTLKAVGEYVLGGWVGKKRLVSNGQ